MYAKLRAMDKDNTAQLKCPHCGAVQGVEIPNDRCLAMHKCRQCDKIITVPKESQNCCVVCEYSDSACPVAHKE